METQDSQRSRAPEWRRHRRRHRSIRPVLSPRGARYAQWIVALLAVALLGRLVWQGIYSARHRSSGQSSSQSIPVSADGKALPVDAVPWQRDTLQFIEESRVAAEKSSITESEIDADRAASTLAVARLRTQIATPDFFQVTATALDRVLQSQPGNGQLLEHVTDARIELAQLRTFQVPVSTGSDDAAHDAASYTNYGDNAPAAGGGSGADLSQRRQTGPTSAASRVMPGRISIEAPRGLAGNQTLDSKMLGGNYLDATFMAASAEILMPPSSATMADNVGVADLTISGASQLLDSIHWKHVTFIGTRLRYSGDGIDLQDVHFIHCTFGFPPTLRGAKLANAIALGQTTISIQ